MEPIQLSDLDRRIVNVLAEHGRLPYKELGRLAGVPTSTCHARVQALEARGVIRGYRADIDPEALGNLVSALVLFQVHHDRRHLVVSFSEELRRIPGVQQVFLIGGDKDIVVHISCESVAALRVFISEHFGKHPAVMQTQTQLIFEHTTGLAPVAVRGDSDAS